MKSGRLKDQAKREFINFRLQPAIAKFIRTKAANERVTQAQVVEACVNIAGKGLKFKVRHTSPPASPKDKRSTFTAV